MRSNLNFHVSFFTRKKSKTPKFSSLYLRISVNSAYKDISLKKSIETAKWNSSANHAKGSSAKSRQVNNFLDKTSTQLQKHYQQLRDEDVLITAEKLKARFLGTDQQHKTLEELLTYHNTQMTHVLTKGTLKNYYTTAKYLREFLFKKHKTPDMYLKQIDYKFTIDLETFLRKKPDLHNNGVMKHMERFKKMMNLACDLEWVDKNPAKRFKLHFEKVDVVYLTIEELQLIKEKTFSRSCLKLTKDIFIFSCYTGLAYADVKNLTPDHINLGIDGGKWIYTKRQKTKTEVRIPLLPEAEAILQKYHDHPKVANGNILLPIYSNQKTNQYLKDIAKKAKVYKKLSFHTARHTFATSVTLANGVPIETVSKLLGHHKIATTQIYARVIDTKISSDMANLRESLSTKKAAEQYGGS